MAGAIGKRSPEPHVALRLSTALARMAACHKTTMLERYGRVTNVEMNLKMLAHVHGLKGPLASRALLHLYCRVGSH